MLRHMFTDYSIITYLEKSFLVKMYVALSGILEMPSTLPAVSKQNMCVIVFLFSRRLTIGWLPSIAIDEFTICHT